MSANRSTKYILVIAGSDSIGGAGIQADVKTIASLSAHALTAVTAVTAQNSLGVSGVHPIPASFVASQIETILEDVVPDAVKIGMVYTGATIKAIARILKKQRIASLVLDPVLRASAGDSLLKPGMVSFMKQMLLPLATVVTPNLDEAEILTGKRVRTLEEMQEACRALKALGPDVVVTGGHLEGECVDLVYDGREIQALHGEKLTTNHCHGTGCVFSSALATFLAMGYTLCPAAGKAGEFTRGALRGGYACGRGKGVVNPRVGALKELSGE